LFQVICVHLLRQLLQKMFFLLLNFKLCFKEQSRYNSIIIGGKVLDRDY